MSTIASNLNFPTSKQVPNEAIMDMFGKQAYLGNQFLASTGVVAIADTSEDNLISLANPATTSKSLFISSRSFFGGDATNSLVYRFYSQPTVIAAGTLRTPTNCRPANGTVSISSCRILPTASTKGTLVATVGVGISNPYHSDVMFILDPGQSVLITVQASGQPTSAFAELVWYEI